MAIYHVFIVRPFGVKEGIDFDRVDADLIAPVLKELGWEFGTTGKIAEAGNIRADMMDLLLTADLVIADISIHNANVFYELGVRHALRHRPTLMIRSKAHAAAIRPIDTTVTTPSKAASQPDVPFDLKTDRYTGYDTSSPEAFEKSRAELKDALLATVRNERTDSPVYSLLPNLEKRNASAYIPVPREFREAVTQAKSGKDLACLGVLADEASRERWCIPGLRLVGRAQFDSNAHEHARITWERVRERFPNDTQANQLLGTIYQRLNDLAGSQAALERALEQRDLSAYDRAEVTALRGRNLKTRWQSAWSDEADLQKRQRAALASGLLLDAAIAYGNGFEEDLNHYYSGLNALSLTVILAELAVQHPAVWEARYDDGEEAELALKQLRRRKDELAAAVGVSLGAARQRAKQPGAKLDQWFNVSVADHVLLTAKNPTKVGQAYTDAAARAEDDFVRAAAARQVQLFRVLGVLPEQVQAAHEALGFPNGVQPEVSEARPLVIVSTGHRVDAEGRERPRFPRGKDHERVAREAISKAVAREVQGATGKVEAIAGLASGNDILFHEVCGELGIARTAGLALPEGEFVRRSVQDSGNEWVDRYRKLRDEIKPEVLTASAAPPPWVTGADKDYAFQRCNMWLLEKAYARRRADVTLIALWNGQGGDGPGGTADMIQLAQERGAKVIILKTQELFGA